MGWEDIDKNEMSDHRPIALSGRVPVKATVERLAAESAKAKGGK